jgi:hypothetical protein
MGWQDSGKRLTPEASNRRIDLGFAKRMEWRAEGQPRQECQLLSLSLQDISKPQKKTLSLKTRELPPRRPKIKGRLPGFHGNVDIFFSCNRYFVANQFPICRIEDRDTASESKSCDFTSNILSSVPFRVSTVNIL